MGFRVRVIVSVRVISKVRVRVGVGVRVMGRVVIRVRAGCNYPGLGLWLGLGVGFRLWLDFCL